MVACFSCHSLCENWETYHVYYGKESFKPYGPGNYTEYNKKNISEQVVSDEVCICDNCIDKTEYHNMYKYAVQLWLVGAHKPTGVKCCNQCSRASESRFCSYYKFTLPWWVKILIDTDKIESTIDLGPVRYLLYCRDWEPRNSTDENSSGSLTGKFRMGLYVVKYYNKNRRNLKRFLFQDLFSFSNFIDKVQSFLNSNHLGHIFGLPYDYLVYKPYRKLWESNIYRYYYDIRARIKDWA